MKFLSAMKRNFQNYLWRFFWQNFRLPEVGIQELGIDFKSYSPKYLEHICLPPYYGEKEFDDYSVIMSVIASRRPSLILELGTAHGNTVANICNLCDAQVYTLNALPDQISGNKITFTLDKDEIGIIYREKGYSDRVIQIFENTLNIDFRHYLKKKSVDFVFIDACHDSDFVVNDFLKIRPLLTDSAIVLFHDTNPQIEKHYIDSYVGCMYLRKMGYNVKQLDNTSLGIWSASKPKSFLPMRMSLENFVHAIIGYTSYRNRKGFIDGLRLLASRYTRERI